MGPRSLTVRDLSRQAGHRRIPCLRRRVRRCCRTAGCVSQDGPAALPAL